MTDFAYEVFAEQDYADKAAEVIAGHLPERGSVVLTGGTTAEKIYPRLAERGADWSDIELFFSDERCVPPTDDASNYAMARRLLFGSLPTGAVHRMRGEDPPEEGAQRYEDDVAPAVESGFDLLLLGMGADAHIGAMFPGGSAIRETSRLCVAVDRPDGRRGLTLTRPAMLPARKILLLVTGAAKAPTVQRVLAGTEGIESCPARALAAHPDVTFLLDEGAASAL